MASNNPAEEEKSKSSKQKSLGLYSSLKKEPEEESQPLLSDEKTIKSSEKEKRRMEKVQKNAGDNDEVKRDRMGSVVTYFALIKGYTTMSLFTMPIGFKYGGWLFSPLILLFVCFFETTMAIRLSWVANHIKIYHYPEIVEYAFGRGVRLFFDIVVAVLHFSFCFAMLAFFAKSLKSLSLYLFDTDLDIWWCILITIIVLAPIVWIRTLESFRYGYIYCAVVIVAMVGLVLYFDSVRIQGNDNQPGPGYTPFNEDSFQIMLGISYATYEGIGTVLPVMEASDDNAKRNFSWLVALALGTISLIHIAFSGTTYYAYGEDIKETNIIL